MMKNIFYLWAAPDIIVKGKGSSVWSQDKPTSGKSSLILSCEVLKGNPSDSTLYQSTINKIERDYQIVPRDSVTDGGYTPKDNAEYSKEKESYCFQ